MDWHQRYWPKTRGGMPHDRPRVGALLEGAGAAFGVVRKVKNFLDEDHALKMGAEVSEERLTFEDAPVAPTSEYREMPKAKLPSLREQAERQAFEQFYRNYRGE